MAGMDYEDGFEIPLHKSLTEKILIMGAPREMTIINGTLGAAFGLGLRSWYIVPICLVFQMVAAALTKRDPQFFDCFRRHIKQRKYYST